MKRRNSKISILAILWLLTACKSSDDYESRQSQYLKCSVGSFSDRVCNFNNSDSNIKYVCAGTFIVDDMLMDGYSFYYKDHQQPSCMVQGQWKDMPSLNCKRLVEVLHEGPTKSGIVVFTKFEECSSKDGKNLFVEGKSADDYEFSVRLPLDD